jgi:hypothetical protein
MSADRTDFLTPEETAQLQEKLARLGLRPGAGGWGTGRQRQAMRRRR